MTSDNPSRAERQGGRSWIPPLIGGRYRVERELGAGAAAVTVAAIDETLGRSVAIKLLRPAAERDPEFAPRFSREARAAASVNSPHVVDVYDVGQDGELLYLVMELVEGSDLRGVIDREGVLSWRQAVEIARSVLSGLSAIHAVGIVHRDIKPQNVLVGTDGSVRVTDFGVAHVERDSSMTTASTTVGTAAYMAPEQAQGDVTTPSADIYAVGVMLYEMVTGRVPFSGPTSMAVMLAHIQQQARPPVAPSGQEALPDGLVAVIRQAMAKDPASRFRSADAMQRALMHPESFRTAAATNAPGRATAQTRAVPAAPTRKRPAPAGRAPTRVAPPGRSEAGGGFRVFLISMLVVLALGLVVVAGVLWYLDQRADDDPGVGSAQPTGIVEETPTAPAGDQGGQEEPGVILPVETLEPPTDAPEPTDVAPTSAPAPTDEIIGPGEETLAPSPTPTLPSTEPDEGVIIVPMDDGPTIEPDQ